MTDSIYDQLASALDRLPNGFPRTPSNVESAILRKIFTPEEAGLTLRRRPIRPNHVTFIRHFVGTLDERWKPYLFMH